MSESRSDARSGATEAPEQPTQLRPRGWFGALRRTAKEFSVDGLTDWAAALTYYGVLSIFPGIIVLLSLVGLAGQNAGTTLTQNVQQLAPGSLRNVLVSGITQLQNWQSQTAGLLAVVGVVGALWSASGYVAAFMRASNAIYDVPEGRPVWKTLPLRVLLTAALMILLAISAVAVVLTGTLAKAVGQALGIGDTAVTIWDIAKWPVLLLVISFMFALLYWASPNAKQGFRWVSPGGILGVLIWLAASGLFALYVANFSSYNKTYGSFATVIVFLVWLWISNIALLLGAEFNAELERGRAMAAGHPESKEPYMELRDDSHVKESDGL